MSSLAIMKQIQFKITTGQIISSKHSDGLRSFNWKHCFCIKKKKAQKITWREACCYKANGFLSPTPQKKEIVPEIAHPYILLFYTYALVLI